MVEDSRVVAEDNTLPPVVHNMVNGRNKALTAMAWGSKSSEQEMVTPADAMVKQEEVEKQSLVFLPGDVFASGPEKRPYRPRLPRPCRAAVSAVNIWRFCHPPPLVRPCLPAALLPIQSLFRGQWTLCFPPLSIPFDPLSLLKSVYARQVQQQPRRKRLSLSLPRFSD